MGLHSAGQMFCSMQNLEYIVDAAILFLGESLECPIQGRRNLQVYCFCQRWFGVDAHSKQRILLVYSL